MAPSWRWEAPEAGAHPLAAIDDAAAVLLCPMLSELADPGWVFVAGESAGAVLIHHLNG